MSKACADCLVYLLSRLNQIIDKHEIIIEEAIDMGIIAGNALNIACWSMSDIVITATIIGIIA